MITARAAMAHCLAGAGLMAAIVVIGHRELGGLGITGSALLLLLPVLWVAARTNAQVGAAMALVASLVLNYFLLPPLYTFTIDGPTYVVIFVVFLAVALVTGSFAAGWRQREAEATERAADSAIEAEFLADIALAVDGPDLDRRALAFLTERFGDARLFARADLAAHATGLSPLDASAATWAIDHHAVTGHASEVMPGADYRFLSFGRGSADVLGLPTGPHAVEGAEKGAFLARIAAHWGQARDRIAAHDERHLREEAQAADRTRRALLAALGHDFRTPLTVLKEGLARLPGAEEAGLPAEVERLRMLGENLLASARLDAGVPFALEPVDLVDVLPAAAQRALMGSPQIALALDLASDLPLVRAEPVMLAHLVGNVIENAGRHAAAQVTITGAAEDDQVVIMIADDGAGVPPEIARAIFDPFVSGRAGGRGSSGLGLAIARDLAAAMDADLALAPPQPGTGARFVLRLPAVPAREDAA